MPYKLWQTSYENCTKNSCKLYHISYAKQALHVMPKKSCKVCHTSPGSYAKQVMQVMPNKFCKVCYTKPEIYAKQFPQIVAHNLCDLFPTSLESWIFIFIVQALQSPIKFNYPSKVHLLVRGNFCVCFQQLTQLTIT